MRPGKNLPSQWLTLVIVLTLLPALAGAQRRWTLDECMDYAIAHNTTMKHLQNEQRQREVSAEASRDARLPHVSGDLGGYLGTLHHGGSNNRFDASQSLFSIGLSAAVPLYTGNRLTSRIKGEAYALMAGGEHVRAAAKDLKVQVAATYLQVLYNKGEAAIARQRQEVSVLLLRRARSLFEQGKCPESDVAETTAMVSHDRALLTAAEGETSMALLELRQLLNMPDTVDFDISEPADSLSDIPPLPSYDVYRQCSSFHPAVQSASYGILQAEQGVTTARSDYYPTLSLVGQLGTAWLGTNASATQRGQASIRLPASNTLGKLTYDLDMEQDWRGTNFLYGFVGLRLSMPLFNAFETRARIRTAKVALDDARLAYDEARQDVRKKIHQAWQGAVTARQRYQAEVEAKESSALAYRYALKRYEAGMATIFDVSQSRQQWFSASERALHMKYEYLIRLRILDIQAAE